MLRFWHLSLLILIALIWKVRPTHASVTDVCEFTGDLYGIYCSCDQYGSDKLVINCFILRNVTITDKVWELFDKTGDKVSLNLSPHRLSSAVLTFIPKNALKNLASLVFLHIHESQLGELKAGAIANLTALSELNLERNEITLLNRYSLSNLPKLEKLILSENYVTEILADSFSGLDELKYLFLDRNNISRIENCGFCNLHNLKELDLATNSLMDLTAHMFKGLRYVIRLILRNNQLRVLTEKLFHGMPRLSELNLQENSIEYISPRAFYNLDHLRALKLQRNKLKTLPDHVFQPLPQLMSLDVSYNDLETLQAGVVSSIPNVLQPHFTILFSNNPLKCSCDLTWISRYHHDVKDNHLFERELRVSQCLDNNNETVLAHKLKLKGCERAKKSSQTVTKPAPATLGSNFKEGTQVNPKYQSEYSDSGTFVNRTSEKTENVNIPFDDNDGNILNMNIRLLLSMVVAAMFNIAMFEMSWFS